MAAIIADDDATVIIVEHTGRPFVSERILFHRRTAAAAAAGRIRSILLFRRFCFLGRGKKTKLKQLKKLMSLLGVIMCAKLSLMGPLAMLMIGAKAVKALMLAVASLTISKMMLLKKLKAGGGGGGGGGYGGSVVQAPVDWSSDKDDRNAHLLAYNGQSSSAQQVPQQNGVYPLYEPHGYYGAAA